ncbi:DUF4335 domain-containing protein [Thermosynechococcaceae cyanobacterium BACA0444]|uniref:DUF4335 domain-containing protein n=1 Tax=Pseudocalidococcus azoricus BACA0444 TaxID=2918990 RepID=A0AAE4FNH9_9CYAN|nr:DUF4335 domain-containing protein [Pseudocalidococcus azoricus]MDS3859231.1 DUF4335 domain-containing protein [Pseudocalidococcus azoricus BACA0444]
MLNQRHYSLPNCVITLEGMSSQAGNSLLLDLVTSCQIQIIGESEPLKGGREFLEALIAAINPVIQTWLSGVKPLKHWFQLPDQNQVTKIHVQAQTPDAHSFLILIPKQLLVPTITDTTTTDTPAPETKDFLELKLSTVQMFDLVEALDQLCQDELTLPSLQLELASLPRRDVAPTITLAAQATPIGLGAVSLAIAATIFFFVPVPAPRQESPITPAPSPAPTAPPSP